MPIFWRILFMSHLREVMSTPSNSICPPEGTSSRLRQRKKVLLPEPEGPIITTFSPFLMCWSTPFSTLSEPKSLVSPLT